MNNCNISFCIFNFLYWTFINDFFFELSGLYWQLSKNNDKYIFFCCDNNTFRQKIKEKYNNVIISNGDIGHTSYKIISNKQILDTITEFYILTKSKKIIGASQSGFSIISAYFNNIPYIKLYDKPHIFF